MSFLSRFNRLSFDSRVRSKASRRSTACQLQGEQFEQRSLMSVNPGGGDDTTPGGGSHISPDYNYLPPRGYVVDLDDGTLSGPASGTPRSIALGYLSAHAGDFGISAADIATMKTTDEFLSPESGVTHLYFQQSRGGLEVLHSRINVNISERGEVISVGENFVPGLNSVPAATPTLTATAAVEAAATALGITAAVPTTVLTSSATGARQTTIEARTFSEDNIPAKLVYAPAVDGGVKLAWQMVVRTPDGQHWYDLAVDASDGKLVAKIDWVTHFSDEYNSGDDLSASALTVAPEPNPLVTPGTYNVIPFPLRGPGNGSRQVITTAGDPIASPFGWHDTDGAPGAEFADTRGNNVFTQIDEDDDNGFITDGFRPNGGPLHTFDFPINSAQNPDTYRPAATTNLFYWNNIIHDVLHHYGFDEASGNFQQTNYSGVGGGGDAVRADAQDAYDLGARNNANMGTPPDGTPPRMQMYVFEPYADGIIRDGDLDSEIIIHEYGHGVSNRLTGGPANAGALFAPQSRGMGEGWSDYLALMLTQQPTDTKLGSRALVDDLFAPLFGGLRRTPYSFDMNINPRLMSDYNYFDPINGPGSLPHNAGEVWAETLWDMSWLLIEKYGYDTDLYYGNGGNNRALQLVIEGMKLQPANPTYLQARDAILLADQQLNFGVNQDAIWTAFARRGMGRDADSGLTANDFVSDGFLHPSAAYNDVLTTEVGLPVSLNVLANDYDADSINLTSVTIVTQPQFGTVFVNPETGVVTYTTFDANATTDTFTYRYSDARGNLSNIANVRVDVQTPQISIADLALAEGNAGATLFAFTVTVDPPSLRPITLNYFTNDITANNGSDYVAPNPGVLTIPVGESTALLNLMVVGDQARELAETFAVMLFNPSSGVLSDSLAIGTILDDESRVAPVATADSLIVDEDTLGVVNVLANDTDSDGSLDPRTVTITTAPINGTATVNPQTGAISYRGAQNYFGTDSLQYTVRDSDGMTSAPVNVAITVNPVNDAPVAVDDMVGTEIGVPVLINVLSNDSDIEDAALLGSAVTLTQQPPGGTASVNPDGTILFTPDAGFSGSTIIQYTVRDSQGLVSVPARVLVRIGAPVEMAGLVFVDANNNGIMDGSEQGIAGVKVTAKSTFGGMTVTQTAITDASGAYRIQESAGVVLPAGTYELAEVHPSFYVDGKDTLGGVAATLNDKFVGLVMTAGQVLTGANFGELGVKPEFVSAFGSRRAFFASTTPGGDNLNLAGGDLWYSFDGGFSGELNAAASFSAGQGSTTLTLLNSSMTAVATSTASNGYAKLSYQGTPGQSYLLKVSGNNPSVAVRTYFGDTWQNLFNSVDTNNDRAVTALDALVVINALNSRTGSSLTHGDLASGHFLDVTGDKVLTALDVLTVINHLNAGPASGSSLQPAALIAQGLAVDAAMEEIGAESSTNSDAGSTTIGDAPKLVYESSCMTAAADFATGSLASDAAVDQDSLDELLELIAR